jgi:hypothetical protein
LAVTADASDGIGEGKERKKSWEERLIEGGRERKREREGVADIG